MSQLCSFCQHDITYDFVGKYETIDDDTHFILDKISSGKHNATAAYPNKLMGPTSARHGKSKTLDEYYKDVPEEIMDKIRTQFKKDFEVLKYDQYQF